MADPRFFSRSGPFSLAELAGLSGATLKDGVDGGKTYSDVAPLDEAASGEVSFLDNRLYLEAFKVSKAGACVVHPDHAGLAPGGMELLLSETPYLAYARIARSFYPAEEITPGVHPSAVIHPSAQIGADCQIGPGVVVCENAEVGEACLLEANAYVGKGVPIGRQCRIGPGTTLVCCMIGEEVRIHSGVKIGQDGFGYAFDEGRHLNVPQLGRVIIGNNVEIGANTTIDRGAGPDTLIGEGCIIDNLVQIGHNVQLGRGCVIVSQVGISGSTKLGNYVSLGGQAGLSGHLTLGDGAQVAAKGGVMKNVEPGVTVAGYPAVPIRDWHRQSVAVARLLKKKGD